MVQATADKKYKRILLKLSGEALTGSENFGIDPRILDQMALEIENDPNLRILIRAGKEVKYKTNQKIMMSCARVGASDLIYSAFEE